MTQPIDYARAESDDVVRKKFRRRVVWFVVVTVVVMVIGVGWIGSWNAWDGSAWGIDSYRLGTSVRSNQGWIVVESEKRTPGRRAQSSPISKRIGNDVIGIRVFQTTWISYRELFISIRYRTLFILAMFPWLITLIRMIRTRRRIHRLETTNS